MRHAKLSCPTLLTSLVVAKQCEWPQSIKRLKTNRNRPSHQKLLLQRFMASNPPFGVLFIFHSHYFFAIGHPEYLAFDVVYHQLVLKFQSARLSLGDCSRSRSTTRLSLSTTRFYIPLVEKLQMRHPYYFTTPEGFNLGCSKFIRHY